MIERMKRTPEQQSVLDEIKRQSQELLTAAWNSFDPYDQKMVDELVLAHERTLRRLLDPLGIPFWVEVCPPTLAEAKDRSISIEVVIKPPFPDLQIVVSPQVYQERT